MALFTFLCFDHNLLDMYLWVSKQMHLSISESRFLCAQMQNCSCGLNSFNPSDGPNPSEVAAAKISYPKKLKCFTHPFCLAVQHESFTQKISICCSLRPMYFACIFSDFISKYNKESVSFRCLFLFFIFF